MPQLRHLLIVSHVVHFQHEGRLFAYGAYAREIDIWADLFPRVTIAAPLRHAPPDGDCLPFSRTNIGIAPQRETGGDTRREKIMQLLSLPAHTRNLSRAMRSADAIHVRCPGNLGLIGAVVAPLFSRYLVAKYTGQWDGFPEEPSAWKLQRRLLTSQWWRGPVTVYGRWPGQPSKVVSFFTSIMTDEQMARARAASRGKTMSQPPRVLYVGRLSEAKNVDVLLSAIARLKSEGVALHCTIVGDGPQRPVLEALRIELDLCDEVSFAGGVDFERVLDFYEQSDVLVLASQTESWGKSITEAMAFGLVCIGSNRGLMPEMLSEGRGFIVPPRDVEALVAALRRIAVAPQEYPAMSARAAAWGQQYSLENLREALRELLSTRWKADLTIAPQPVAAQSTLHFS